jgi:cell division protein FtsW
MKEHRNHIDFTLMVAVLTLMLLSLGVVYSASSSYAQLKTGDSEKMLISHAIKVLIGIIGMFFFMRIDYTVVRRFTKIAVIFAVIILFVTLVLGVVSKGATRWIRVESFGFQPSEFAKYALLFHVCTLLATKQDIIDDFRRGFLPMMFWIATITALVMAQPNFSMGTMIVMLSMLLLFVGNVRIKHLLLTFLAILPLIIVYMFIADYRMKRITDFLNGSSSGGSQANYQPWQSILAFGNGGIFGVGPGESKQRDLFLPESYGDFVFSIVGEEYGFLGTIFFMAIFFYIMIRGFRIAKYAPDIFSRYLALAITWSITFYALINAGVTLGILPTTGLPMPFVSYGGSSMVFSACAVGVLLNISSHTDLIPRAREVPVIGSVDADNIDIRKVY